MFFPTVIVNGQTVKPLDVFNAVLPKTSSCSFPMDIYEDKDNVYVSIEAAGMNKDSINIDVKNGILSVSAKKQQKGDDIKYVTRQSTSSGFSKEFTLDETLDPNKISAEYQNGVLVIQVGKKEIEKPRQIKIKIN